MKALDTNVLVRFLVRDDEKQAAMVKRVLLGAEKNSERFFIPIAVTLETMWVLSSAYECSRKEIVDVFDSLLSLPVFLLEDHICIATLCRKALTTEADLSDLLIGIIARERGCATTMTFDKKASRSEFFTLIE
jgi:predicted nucleic-acid-binding protein